VQPFASAFVDLLLLVVLLVSLAFASGSPNFGSRDHQSGLIMDDQRAPTKLTNANNVSPPNWMLLSNPPSVFNRDSSRQSLSTQRRVLLLGLQLSSQISTQGVTLSSDYCLRHSLRRYKRHGFLGTANF
jgi:hypothetical protein